MRFVYRLRNATAPCSVAPPYALETRDLHTEKRLYY